MEDGQSYGLKYGNKGPFSTPEEDVSSTKNKNSSSDGHRKVGNTESALALVQSTKTVKKGDSPSFLGHAGEENLSTLSNGDITSPQAMSMETMRSDILNSQETSFMEQGQLVIAGLLCLVKQPRSKLRYESGLHYPMEETLWHDNNRATSQSTKLVASGGPYLNKDGTLKAYHSYQGLHAGTVIYAATRVYLKRMLDDWKQLPYNDNVLPLSGVLMADNDCIYQVTECMEYDLRQARNEVTLIQLARTQTNEEWQHTMRNFKHIIRSILKGIIHLNCNKYQHYDIKEENIFVNKPAGCQCNSILECTCEEKWVLKVGDFDTLSTMEQPLTGICGTRFYHPPEYEGKKYDLRYERPTYDSWSILIIILHFCCGTAKSASDQQARNLPWLRSQQECHYACDRFRVLCKESTTYNYQLSPLVTFTAECLEVDFRTRPTPEEMLRMWDTACI